ncbi:MAG: DUF4316 domain-containing protein [Lachnospiraceae bacterium]|nr:DUF4316 domain-containing protein [Lachnospiraceae bacterium]
MADSPVSLEQARSTGESPIISGYDLIATDPIMRGADALAILEEYRANGFARPGDVVSFKQDGAVTCWYVDQLAFSKLPGLLENHLKTAELGMEQNCNQIDGIINNEAPKPSLRDDLKRCQQKAADRAHGGTTSGPRHGQER